MYCKRHMFLRNNTFKINNSIIDKGDRSEVYINPAKATKLVKRNVNISDASNFLKSYEGCAEEYFKQKKNKAGGESKSSKKRLRSYDFTKENIDDLNRMQESWLDGRTKRKQIGPHC